MIKAYQIRNGIEKADWEWLLIISSNTKTKDQQTNLEPGSKEKKSELYF